MGCGLKSIEKIVDKYNGEMNIKTENNIFKIMIALPEENKYVEKLETKKV